MKVWGVFGVSQHRGFTTEQLDSLHASEKLARDARQSVDDRQLYREVKMVPVVVNGVDDSIRAMQAALVRAAEAMEWAITHAPQELATTPTAAELLADAAAEARKAAT